MKLFGHHIDRSIFWIFILDALILALAFYGAYFARWADPTAPTQYVIAYAPNAAIFITLTLLSMIGLGCYERSAMVKRRVIGVRLFAAFFVAVLSLAVVFYAIPDLTIWRSGLIIAVPVSFTLILILRFALADNGITQRFARRVLLLTDGSNPVAVREVFADDGVSSVRLVGTVELGSQKDRSNDPSWLLDKARASKADEIVVQIEGRRQLMPVAALRLCRLRGQEILNFADFAERETGRVDLDHVGSDWLIFARGFTNSDIDRFAKRVFDVFVSSLILAFTFPLILTSAAIVKWQDGGPILFKQARVGLHGREFMLYKLRSMRVDAEKDGPQFAAQGDDRSTAYGRFMRRCRIDELPQLINILKGEMSFVGPRPERPMFVDDLARSIPFFRERHMVKPGLSGWAQVNHPYSDDLESTRRKLEFDMYYVKNSSIFLDVIVLAQTLRVVIWGSGAR